MGANRQMFPSVSWTVLKLDVCECNLCANGPLEVNEIGPW